MSIQAARETMARTRGQARAVDPQFFAKIDAKADKLDASQGHPADWQRLRSEVVDWMKAHTNRTPFTDNDQGAWDHAEARIAYCEAKAELGGFAVKHGKTVAPNSGWIDAKTKEPIRVYKPDERLAKPTADNGVSLGAMLEGYLIGPRNGEVKAALDGATGSAGGLTVPIDIAMDFIDRLRARSVFIQAGANTVPLNGPTRMISLDQDPTAIWRSENQPIGDSDIAVGALELNPKSLSALVKVSYELLADSGNIEQILMTALMNALSLELDRACLFGKGTQYQPVGLYNYPGVTAISMGTNGAQITNYDPLVDMLYELEVANANPPTAAIWHPRTVRDLRKRKDTTNQPMLAPDVIAALPKLATTSVPINLTQGTANSIASPILMGDFNDAILGIREELTIIPLTETYAGNGQVGFWARLRADVGFARPKSFVKLDGVIP